MQLSWEPLPLDLRTTFRIAHGASDHRDNVLVRLDEGLGEAAAVAYHGETPEGIMAQPLTSFTIAMAAPEAMAEQAREAGLPIYKIKVGGAQDVAAVAAIRAVSSARLRVDANAGWSREQAAALIPQLADYDLELVEQPLPVGDIEGPLLVRNDPFTGVTYDGARLCLPDLPGIGICYFLGRLSRT